VPHPGPVLALDVGTAKIGLAVTDAGRRMSFPLVTVPRSGVRRDAERLASIARDRGVTLLVVGLPSGRVGRLARQVGEATAAMLGVPVEWADEAFSSAEARARIAELGLSRRDVDQHAAVVILEAWLAAHDDA
jgi:putative Holliday junction resolvase